MVAEIVLSKDKKRNVIMNFSAINHRNSYEYLTPLTRTTLAIRLKAATADLQSCHVVYFSRYKPITTAETTEMVLAYRDRYNDDFRATLHFNSPTRFLRYFFELIDTEGKRFYLHEYGFSESIPEDGYFEYQYTNESDCVRVPDWARGIIYYQIFPDRYYKSAAQKARPMYLSWESSPKLDGYFGGDLPGITEKLPWIAELGAEAIYLNPIFQAENNHKYATTDYFRIDPDFGTMDDFRTFIQRAHERNIRVILDGVFNHSGKFFPPFKDFIENRENSEYYRWFLPCERGKNGEITRYEAFADWGNMPKLNSDYPAVRNFIIEVMLHWLREGIDGWRLDVADEVPLSTWVDVRNAVKREFPDALLIAETWRDATRYLTQGDKFDTTMNYAFREAARDFFARRTVSAADFVHRINHTLSLYADITNDVMFNLLDSHDTPRFLHDSGNDIRRQRLAACFQMTFLGAPSIYYGNEIGMTGAKDPDCRRGMIWNEADQDLETLTLYKKLILLRKNEIALRKGSFRILYHEEPGLVVFRREAENQSLICVLNNSDQTAQLSAGDLGLERDVIDLMTQEKIERQMPGSMVQIPAMTMRILKACGI